MSLNLHKKGIFVTTDPDNGFKPHPEFHQIDDYLKFNNAIPEALNENDTILVRVHCGGVASDQVECFEAAVVAIKLKYRSLEPLLMVQYLNNDIARSEHWKPKDIIDWLMSSDIHALLGHFHQGAQKNLFVNII